MASVVVDTSAVLALIHSEPGADRVAAEIYGAAISTVNLAEVITKLVARGTSVEVAAGNVAIFRFAIFDFTRALAEAAGALVTRTRRHGLSLGDRACLALGEAERLPVLTADKSWREVKVTCEVRLIR